MTNCRMVEVIGTVAVIFPTQQTAGAVATTGGIPTYFRKHLYTLIVGAVPAGATVDLKLQASTTGLAGGSWTDVPGSNIVTLTAANSVAQVEAQADRLAALNLGAFVRAVVTVGGGTCGITLLVQGGDDRYFPATDYGISGLPTPVLI